MLHITTTYFAADTKSQQPQHQLTPNLHPTIHHIPHHTSQSLHSHHNTHSHRTTRTPIPPSPTATQTTRQQYTTKPPAPKHRRHQHTLVLTQSPNHLPTLTIPSTLTPTRLFAYIYTAPSTQPHSHTHHPLTQYVQHSPSYPTISPYKSHIHTERHTQSHNHTNTVARTTDQQYRTI
nr:putative uncharacterized protein FLJ46204 [Penaeus vannamei]